MIFFSLPGFEIQSNFDYKTIKNQAQGRVRATISKFSAQVFEAYFSMTYETI